MQRKPGEQVWTEVSQPPTSTFRAFHNQDIFCKLLLRLLSNSVDTTFWIVSKIHLCFVVAYGYSNLTMRSTALSKLRN